MQPPPFKFPPGELDTPPFMGLVSNSEGWSVTGFPKLRAMLSKVRGWCLCAAEDFEPKECTAFTPLTALRLLKSRNFDKDKDYPPCDPQLLDACYGACFVCPR